MIFNPRHFLSSIVLVKTMGIFLSEKTDWIFYHTHVCGSEKHWNIFSGVWLSKNFWPQKISTRTFNFDETSENEKSIRFQKFWLLAFFSQWKSSCLIVLFLRLSIRLVSCAHSEVAVNPVASNNVKINSLSTHQSFPTIRMFS